MGTVGKKFTDPEKWDQPWFANLSPGQKALYIYLWDRCDHAGVIHIVPRIWSAHLGKEVTEVDLEKLQKILNSGEERMVLRDGIVWFTKYIRINQQPDLTKPLSAKKPFTTTIVKLLKEHGLYNEAKDRDPILLLDWENKNGGFEPNSIEYSTHSYGIPMATSKSTSNSKSRSKGENVYSSLKDIIPRLKLLDLNEISMQSDIDRVIEVLKSYNVNTPDEYILEIAAKYDWDNREWEDFLGDIAGPDINDIPF